MIRRWIRKILGVPGIEQLERILEKTANQILNEQQEEIEALRHQLGIEPPSPFKQEPVAQLEPGEPEKQEKIRKRREKAVVREQ